MPLPDGIVIRNARNSDSNRRFAEYLYAKQQRHGFLFRDCQRLVNQDRNVFAACMVALGDADAIVTGVTRSYSVALEGITSVIDPAPGGVMFGLTLLLARVSGTVFVADTAIHERPDVGLHRLLVLGEHGLLDPRDQPLVGHVDARDLHPDRLVPQEVVQLFLGERADRLVRVVEARLGVQPGVPAAPGIAGDRDRPLPERLAVVVQLR